MTLDQLESISVIAASWFGIIVALLSIFKAKAVPEPSSKHSNSPTIQDDTWRTKYTIWVYIKWVKYYLVAILFFALVLANVATNNTPVSALSVISISACTGAIILMITGCAYKYVLWQLSREFDSNIEC